MMDKIKSKFKIKHPRFLIFVFCLSFLLFNFGEVWASQLSLESQTQKIAVNKQFKLNLILNTENEDVNAIESKITFPEDLLELKQIRYSKSIINYWIKQPKLNEVGAIDFAGIMLGGFQKTKGFLLSAIFQTKASGNGIIQISDAMVLLNDGEGTETNLKTSSFQFSIF